MNTAIANIFKRNTNIENTITLYLNYMLVAYAFLIPIDSHARSSLLSVMLILFIYRGNVWIYLKESLSNKVVQAFLLLYILWIVGLLYTENFDNARSGLYKSKYLLLPLFFLTFLDLKFSFKIINAFIFGMFFSEIISYAISFHLLPNKFYLFDFKVIDTIYSDPTPFFNHINHSIGLAVAVSLLLYQFLNTKQSLFIKILGLLFMISASINMSFIGGRTGYVVYIILIILTFLLSAKKNIIKDFIISIVLVVSISVLAYNTSSMINKRVNQTVKSIGIAYSNENFSTSVGIRIGLVKYSLQTIKDNYLFGVGTGDALDEVKKRTPEKYAGMLRMSELHNVYMQTMLQFGIVGLIVLFYLFYTVLVYRYNEKQKRDIAILLTICVMFVMIPGSFYGHFVLPMYATLISAMINTKDRLIKYENINSKEVFIYIALVISFYLIAVFR